MARTNCDCGALVIAPAAFGRYQFACIRRKPELADEEPPLQMLKRLFAIAMTRGRPLASRSMLPSVA
jgi:hypothetical protein